jgi:hypothetical protein
VPRANPCKSKQYGNAICVPHEAHPHPTTECFPVVSKKPTTTRKLVKEKVVEKVHVEVQIKRNPLNVFFIITTVLLLVALIFIVSWVASPQMRI